jgi:hypothetical protein
MLYDFIRNGKEIFQKITFEIIFIMSWLIYWIYIGGDNYVERFLVILFPLGIFTIFKFIGRVFHKKALILLTVSLILIQSNPLSLDPRFDYSLQKYDCWITLGRFLKQKYPGKTLAVCATGKIPYFSDLRVIDMLGLNDTFIAHKAIHTQSYLPGHNKFDPDYILSRAPDIISTWIDDNLDLTYGLTKKKYEANYKLRYLTNMKKRSVATNIIDVSNLDEGEISYLITSGYTWAVLEKIHDRNN